MKKINIAIILAGGSGSRMTSDTPKQFNKIAGKSVLEHTVEIFKKHDQIKEIYITIPEYLSEEAQQILRTIKNQCDKPIHFITGGATRNISTLNAIKHINYEHANVLIHDSARPLLSRDILERAITALDMHLAIDTVTDCTDTIVEIDEYSNITSIPNRNKLRSGQTPQGFDLRSLKLAYALAQENNDLSNSDDCSILAKYSPDIKIHCIQGSESNIKITHPIDLVLADKLFLLRTNTIKIQEHSNVDLRNKVYVIFGGSSGIGEALCKALEKCGATAIPLSRSLGGVDICNHHSIADALAKIEEKYNVIDGVINSAGQLITTPINGSLESIEKNIESVKINLIAAINIASISKSYLEKSKGHLLLFTSSSYTRGRANYGSYSASKAGIVNLTQALSEEWSERNIKVNCINPERTNTKMRQDAFPNEEKSNMLTAAEVAQIAVSTLQQEISGQIIDIKRTTELFAIN